IPLTQYALMAWPKAPADCTTEEQVALAKAAAPPAHCLSRVADQNESQARFLLLAQLASAEASATEKVSELTSLTPIIGVTATFARACDAESEVHTDWTWPAVALAACSARVAMSPVNEAP